MSQMSQINPYYRFRVMQLRPRACPIPLTAQEKAGKPDDELFTDGILVELTDAAGKKHHVTVHRAAFPTLLPGAKSTKVEPGVKGNMIIESADPICVDLNDFKKGR